MLKSERRTLPLLLTLAIAPLASSAQEIPSPESKNEQIRVCQEDRGDSIARIRELIQNCVTADRAIQTGSSRISVLDLEIRTLRRDKEIALQEARNARFCSRCGKSASELAREGINFENHLAEVQGQRVAATPEQLAAIELRFDSQIQPKVDEAARTRSSLTDWEWKRQTDSSAIDSERRNVLMPTYLDEARLRTERGTLILHTAQASVRAMQPRIRDANRRYEDAKRAQGENSPLAQTFLRVRNLLLNQLDQRMTGYQSSDALERASYTDFLNEGVNTLSVLAREVSALSENRILSGSMLATGFSLPVFAGYLTPTRPEAWLDIDVLNLWRAFKASSP